MADIGAFIQRWQAGDERAAEAIYNQYRESTFRLAFGLLGNPADAEEKGIQEGDRVRIFNSRGALELEARFDCGTKRGCLVVPNGWWITDGGNVNFMSEGRETDIAHGAAFHENLVDIEKTGN